MNTGEQRCTGFIITTSGFQEQSGFAPPTCGFLRSERQAEKKAPTAGGTVDARTGEARRGSTPRAFLCRIGLCHIGCSCRIATVTMRQGKARPACRHGPSMRHGRRNRARPPSPPDRREPYRALMLHAHVERLRRKRRRGRQPVHAGCRVGAGILRIDAARRDEHNARVDGLQAPSPAAQAPPAAPCPSECRLPRRAPARGRARRRLPTNSFFSMQRLRMSGNRSTNASNPPKSVR